jgi:hypothetical protein
VLLLLPHLLLLLLKPRCAISWPNQALLLYYTKSKWQGERPLLLLLMLLLLLGFGVAMWVGNSPGLHASRLLLQLVTMWMEACCCMNLRGPKQLCLHHPWVLLLLLLLLLWCCGFLIRHCSLGWVFTHKVCL